VVAAAAAAGVGSSARMRTSTGQGTGDPGWWNPHWWGVTKVPPLLFYYCSYSGTACASSRYPRSYSTAAPTLANRSALAKASPR
jgi:hypothetical protein